MKQLTIPSLLTLILTVSLLSFSAGSEARKSHQQNDDFGQWLHRQTGGFDYYLLTLSWSPEFCNSPAGHKTEKQLQCSAPLGFVIHGLWPQYNNNDYPHDCGPEAEIPPDVAAIAQSTNPPMPPGDPQLLRHEWSKHGSCSGLDMAAYFTAIKTSAEKLKIPEILKAPHNSLNLGAAAIVTAFTSANPGLSADMINIETDRQGYVSGIQICFSKQLAFQPCAGGHAQQGGTFLPVK
ncbi:MAG: ribonuclease T(2) [Methylococcales bacterium]|nr:ribonuclease T(2) [Methylococcales bacterium]